MMTCTEDVLLPSSSSILTFSPAAATRTVSPLVLLPSVVTPLRVISQPAPSGSFAKSSQKARAISVSSSVPSPVLALLMASSSSATLFTTSVVSSSVLPTFHTFSTVRSMFPRRRFVTVKNAFAPPGRLPVSRLYVTW